MTTNHFFAEKKAVTWQGKRVAMPKKPLALVRVLAERPGVIVPYQQIANAVLGENQYRAMDMHTRRVIATLVKRVRHYLKAVDPGFDLIETLDRVGYRWRADNCQANLCGRDGNRAQNGMRADSKESRA